ncbi:wax ester/triacylglycerol synthase family O-acyltransferase [Rhodococcus sp. NPDC056960]|uniref:wax ester/triacylglycerol synthase family O-acyltransferase n=1 Tax=Rhodococcus sp. NPDC056960 TaxID=3345982 RepID=UPI0036442526
MERLTAQDVMTLWPDRAGWSQDIGLVAVLDAGDFVGTDGRFLLGDVRRSIEARLPRVPRLRQVVYEPRWGLGRPLWVDAASFDVRDHVRAVSPVHRGGEARLLEVVEELRRRPLDRGKPLWEMWFVPGLADGRIGVYLRVHHVIADGPAGVAMLGALFDAGPDGPVPRAEQWVPAPVPAGSELIVDNLRRRWAEVARVLAACSRPATIVCHARGAWLSMREMVSVGRAPRSSLNRPIGAAREFAVVRTELATMKRISDRHGVKVNDVLLDVFAGGLRELLRSRGEPVDNLELRAVVPVSLHREQPGPARGNLLGQMIVALPLGIDDPVHRLASIAADTATRKRGVRPRRGAVIGGRVVRWMAPTLVSRQRMMNTYVADVPGPPVPLYLLGAIVREIVPVVALMGNIAVGAGAFSYAGQFTITVVGDTAVCPEVDVVARGMEETLQTLEAPRRPD